jgi:cell division protein FtsI/penicillin-binding protein 2
VEEAKRFALKTVIKRPARGTIRDRFNHPLAINSICYAISILYDPIKSLPTREISYVDGEKKLHYRRKEAIQALSSFLSPYVDMDKTAIEDIIYSKASLFPNTPFTLKKGISEEAFYTLKMQEYKYPGLNMRITKKRTYPMGKSCSHILGYLGAIDEKQHLDIKFSINTLTSYLENQKNGIVCPLPKGYNSIEDCKQSLNSLINKSYTIHSYIGKSGIEKVFDKELKGSTGKSFFLVDHKGNWRHKLPESYEEIPGRRILLTISSKLQDHCEKLLADSEKLRMDEFESAGKDHGKISPPWIFGGSIVAMIPSSGEIVAMASYPCFDPGDFSEENKDKALKWLETSTYIGQVFDGQKPLEKDIYNITNNKWETLTQKMDYSYFLSTILSKNSTIHLALKKVENIHRANFLLNTMEMLLNLSEELSIHPLIDALYYKNGEHSLTFYNTDKENIEKILAKLTSKTSLLKEIRAEIDPYFQLIHKNDDKILFLDILQLFCPNHLFDDSLLSQTGSETLATYKEFTNAKIHIEKKVEEIVKKVFHEIEFKEWRNAYFKEYLNAKRLEEKIKKSYQKPYLTYLEEAEEALFNQFFSINKWEFISAYLTVGAKIKEKDIRLPYFQALIEKGLNNIEPSYIKLKNHLSFLSSEQIIPYIKTMRSFNELTRPLYGKYYFAFKSGKIPLEKDLARAFHPKGGYCYTKSYAFTENSPLGSSFKIFTGYKALMDYYSCNENLSFPLNPMTIIDKSPPYSTALTKDSVLGYKEDYSPIKRIYKGGRLPRGHPNVGKIDFQGAMERSSNLYFSLLSSNVIKDPASFFQTTKTFGFGSKTGVDLPYEANGSIPSDIITNKTSLYSFAFGQHSLIVTPLQTAVALCSIANGGEVLKPQIVKAIANIEPTQDNVARLFKKRFRYQNQYKNIGIYFPLFPEGEENFSSPYLKKMEKQVIHNLNIPTPVQQTLMQSLYGVVNGSRGTARSSSIRSLLNNPYKRRIYEKVMPTMGGKTSTAEIAYKPTFDRQQKAVITKNIWFTAVSFNDTAVFSHPDLVVIVQLRFGDHGKESCPLAASVIEKWHEILSEELNFQKDL